jgi:hypothetical protein
MFRDRVLSRLVKVWKVSCPAVVSILQFSQQLREQLHASVPALAHTVYSGGETGYLSLARLMRHPSQEHLGSSAVCTEP